MSTPATIPILGTDQQVHSIPQDQLGAALQAGGMPVATVRDPQGQMRYIPSNQVETARAMGGAVVSRAPQSEELDFLQKNPGHAWLSRDPQKFPNREEGIYPSGPGNEWRNDPTSPMASNTQAPIDLHLGLHTYQGMKTGLLAATAPLALEASVPQLIGGLAGGTAGSYAGQKIAQAAGAGPVGQEIAGDVGGLAGGALGARQASGFVRNFRAGLNPPATATYPGAPLPETPPTAVLQASSLARGPQPVIDRAQGLGSIPVAKNFPGAPYPENPGVFPGASLPASPTPELLQSRGLTQGATVPPPEPSAALGRIPVQSPGMPAPGQAGSMAESLATTPSGAGLPRTLSGESALGQVLSRLDNASLLRIARSRAINVSQESLLKPGTANNLLINKIANDFSPDELQEFAARHLEASRFQHQFPSDMTPENWSVIALQHYFPSIKLPLTALRRAALAAATSRR